MSEPVRREFTEPELHDFARRWMVANEGMPKDLEPDSRERWYERLGLLTQFVVDLWNDELETRA